MAEMAEKVLVYWTEENTWSIISISAVRGEAFPGRQTFAKFLGKWYPAVIIAKDHPKALATKETEFKAFLNSSLQEEPENIDDRILEFINEPSGIETHDPIPTKTQQTVNHLSSAESSDEQEPPAKKPKLSENASNESSSLSTPKDKPAVLAKQGPESSKNNEKGALDELLKSFKKLKDRVRSLEKWQRECEDSAKSGGGQPSGANGGQPCGANSSQPSGANGGQPCGANSSQPSGASGSQPSGASGSQPNSPSSGSLYNGKTLDMLQDSVNFYDDLYSTVRTLMTQLFSDEYIASHSVSGQRSNSNTTPKPKFDSRLFDAMVSVVKKKFPAASKSDITLKVQSVQKKTKKALF